MKLIRGALFFTVLLLSPLPVNADVFQYFDQDGTLIITDTPHPADRPRVLRDRASKGIKAEYKEGVYYEYYPVTGSNFQELMQYTSMNGPFDDREGRRFPAVTRWKFGWSYKFDYSYKTEEALIHAAVNISSVDFQSDITVVLPMIAENTVLNSNDLNAWNSYVQQLLAHEQDHVKIITDSTYKDKASKAISGLKAIDIPHEQGSDIDELVKKAVEAETGKIGHDILKEIKRRNDEYDRITEHGLKPKMREVFFGQ